jgi:hypothetical protein
MYCTLIRETIDELESSDKCHSVMTMDANTGLPLVHRPSLGDLHCSCQTSAKWRFLSQAGLKFLLNACGVIV